MDYNGWTVLQHPLFAAQLKGLSDAVAQAARQDPGGYQRHPKAKLLMSLQRLTEEVIPANPNAPAFRQGNTLGPDNRHWFRVKFHQRFRLFFRFSSKQKILIYVWMNEETTLRKRGARTDVYAVFKQMLDSGYPPSSFDDLLKQSQQKNR